MLKRESGQLFQRVRAHAFQSLSFDKRETTNLHLDEHIYQEGETIGPELQKIITRRPNVLVFIDDMPLAAFAHPCRYLLYDARTGEFEREVPAEFPPYVTSKPASLKAFHEPVRFIENPNLFHVRPPFRCPITPPVGRRYAILFSGVSTRQPLNDMEFLYRTLTDVYAYDRNNIYVLHFDGTLNSLEGVPSTWPGDGTAYRIFVNGPGTRMAFEGVIDHLKGKIGQADLLLIHTNQCGGRDLTAGLADLNTYPDWSGYNVNDFASKLGELPRYSKLMVMMSQCFSGGFSNPILAHSTADATSIACAATEWRNAFVSTDGNWDSFARDWISAQAGHDPFGGALAFNPDRDNDGKVGAEEAFNYAVSLQNPNDSPNFVESSEAGGDIALGQQYIIWQWWCWIHYEVLQPYRIKLPPPEYYKRLHKVQSELTRLTAELDKTSDEMRKEMITKIESLVTSVFKR
jgi:hypothetical protein